MATMQLSRPANNALRSVDHNSRLPALRSLMGKGSTTESGRQAAAPKSVSKLDFNPTENFTHLKLTAERMMQDQASTKTDLSIIQSKLQKFEEKEKSLEVQKQELHNENQMLRVKLQEDEKKWQSLETRLQVTSAFGESLTDTLTSLQMKVTEGETFRRNLEEKLSERARFYEETHQKLVQISDEKISAELEAAKRYGEIADLQKRLSNLQDEVKAKRDELLVCIQAKKKLEAELQNAEASNQSLQETVRSSREEEKALQEQLEETRGRSKHLGLRLEETLQRLAESEKNRDSLSGQLLESKGEMQELTKQLSAASDEVTKLEAAYEKARMRAEKVAEELNTSNTQVSGERENTQRLEAEVGTLKGNMTEAARRYQQLYAQHEADAKVGADKEASLASEIGRLSEILNATQNELRIIATNRDHQDQTISQLQNQKTEIEAAAVALTAKVEEIQVKFNQELDEKTVEIDRLNAAVTEMATARDAYEKQLQAFKNESEKETEEKKHLRSALGQTQSANTQLLERVKVLEENIVAAANEAKAKMEQKQAELNKHLKEISDRNNQEMAEIRKALEDETKGFEEEKANAQKALAKAKEEFTVQLCKERDEHQTMLKAHSDDLRAKMEKEAAAKEAAHAEIVADLTKLLKAKEAELEEAASKTKTRTDKKAQAAAQRQQEEAVKAATVEVQAQLQEARKEATSAQNDMAALKSGYEKELKELRGALQNREQEVQEAEAVQKSDVGEGDAIRTELEEKAAGEEIKLLDLTAAEPEKKAPPQKVVKGKANERGGGTRGGARGTKQKKSAEPTVVIDGAKPKQKKRARQTRAQEDTDEEEEEIFNPAKSSVQKIRRHEIEVATSRQKQTVTHHKKTKSVTYGETLSGGTAQTKIQSSSWRRTQYGAATRQKPPAAAISTGADLFGDDHLDPYALD